jgi:hypothetical protein
MSPLSNDEYKKLKPTNLHDPRKRLKNDCGRVLAQFSVAASPTANANDDVNRKPYAEHRRGAR